MNIRKSLNPAFLKVKPHRDEIEKFKISLQELLNRIDEQESEEHNKNDLIDFFKKTYYDPNFYINTYHRKDLVIYSGKDSSSPIGVIIETKSPSNKYEMCSKDNINAKALQELLLYYLEERVEAKNTGLKHLIVTNVNEWFIFKATDFEKLVYGNKSFVKEFKEFKRGGLSGDRTNFFYNDIAKPFIETIKDELEYTHFDIRTYKNILKKNNPDDDKKLIAPYKVFSPQHLLVLPFANDSNSLDRKFYSELLHIIGLKEVKEGSKKLIQRYPKDERHAASLLENAITKLDSRDHLSQIENLSSYGVTRDEQLFAVGLELCITWINRVLFLKLLEAQLLSYHKNDDIYKFLNIDRIHNFDDLDNLFFSVLAKKNEERDEKDKNEFGNIPYLNSSLFEPAPLEHKTIFITDLRDDLKLPIISSTILKNEKGKKRSGKLNTIEYLFRFLDAYDFTSEGKEDIQEESKTLINASVLGLIFEKINGYKDGSYFTPGFITEYMCRETIRRAVVQKFNDAKDWNCKEFDELYDKIEDRKEANSIVNSLKICDPAVGSGHFLVSALNEILAIKHELRILEDRKGNRLKEYTLSVENDELVIMDEDNKLFDYHPGSSESQRVQEAIFHEKQVIIENCLFGVDINPNSVKICRLRLWIELLKNAYYKNDVELETLPNIDINIKCGNSLISRYDLDVDIADLLKNSKFDIDTYKDAHHLYQHAPDKTYKRKMEELIETIKGEFKKYISKLDPVYVNLRKAEDKFRNFNLDTGDLFGVEKTTKQKAKDKARLAKLSDDFDKAQAAVKDAENNVIYSNAFEWRFEFPEVLDDKGNFIGFDVVIGNPPWGVKFNKSELKHIKHENSDIVVRMIDSFMFFMNLDFKLTNKNGFVAQIIPDVLLYQLDNEKLRAKIINKYHLHSVINLGDNIFVDVARASCIVIVGKTKSNTYLALDYSKTVSKEFKLDDFSILSDGFYNDLPNKVFATRNFSGYDILKRINGNKLINLCDESGIQRGISPDYKNAFIVDSKIISNKHLERDYLFPTLEGGRDLQKYYANIMDKKIIYTSRNDDPDKIPNIIKHIDCYRDKITCKEVRQGKHPYWSLHRPREKEVFNPNKIIGVITGDKIQVSLDEFGLFPTDGLYVLKSNNQYSNKFLVGLLNSTFLTFLYRLISMEEGRVLSQIKPSILEELPILNSFNNDLVNLVEKEVDKIIDKLKLSNKNIDEETNKIDQLVYKLYDLTEEEIKIVEGE